MKNILIYGLGKSGVASFNLLFNKKNRIYIFDDDLKVCQDFFNKVKENLNVFALNALSHDIIMQLNLIVVSPSISKENKFIKIALKNKIKVISELELGFLNTHNKFVCITGTNGKTTTTKLLGLMFDCAKRDNKQVGNIGMPVSAAVKEDLNKKQTFICEVSSFQLDFVEKFRPKMVGFLNLTTDHLDRHKTLKNYFETKQKIFKKMKRREFAILNENDLNLKCLAQKIKCKVYYINAYKKCIGAYLNKNDIYFFDGKREKLLANINKTNLIGTHNCENILCSTLMAHLSKISKLAIQQAIDTFLPSPHRLEQAEVVNEVLYIDDSKATNIGSVLCATRSFSKPITLLLGGSDKGYCFNNLIKNLPTNVIRIICFGETANKIFKAAKAEKFKNIKKTTKLKNAVIMASKLAQSGEVVLLSPACASFDEFENYKDRGLKFKKYVGDLLIEKKKP